MSFTYIVLFLIFVADIVWVVIHIIRATRNNHDGEDDEGGILGDFDPVLDLPPGITLPEDGPSSGEPVPTHKEDVPVYA
ncbi:hypothetical protein AB9P05_07880 [Roseivirga sp. BDSF3-8]|uniref:hypothetical protein n=1 Tax=Roseivirga sp. BDSF3-8 TaxID=3241598 RepID=UPI0035318955